MKNLKPTIPGLDEIFKFYSTSVTQPGKIDSLGSLLTGLLNIAFFAAVFLAFLYMVWGAFAYIMAQGKKEDLAKARARLSWAIIGMVVVLLAYSITKFVSEMLTPGTGGLPF